MHIYFSGLGGVGIGPLAEIAHDAGYSVSGSDLQESPMTRQLAERGINVTIGQSDDHIRRVHDSHPIDWFVYTAALPADHSELQFAKKREIHAAKRDELLAKLLDDKQLKLVAVSGTHGKTTTTGLLVWAFAQLGIPLSYSVGSTLSFGSSGQYRADSRYFVYECDEFDRNMLHFWPHLSLITSLDHDHYDTYPTLDEYRDAFVEYMEKSDMTLLWEREVRYIHHSDITADYEAYDETMELTHLTLPGRHNRENAYLVQRAIQRLLPERSEQDIIDALNSFPGTGRRFEKLAENLYSDYAHHPAEIKATVQMARELSKDVVVVYQPHQNVRQHKVKDDYTDCLDGVTHIYWTPTYLTREKAGQPILSPEELTTNLTNQAITISELDDDLWKAIDSHRKDGALVLVMGAGPIDGWVRQRLGDTSAA